MTQASGPGYQPAFHLFPILPPELRLKIWEYNLPPPRLVEIRCGPSSLMTPGQARLGTSGCTSPVSVPTNLRVCRESRREALLRYQLMFGIAHQTGIFFDPARDILYFGPRDGYLASEAQFRTVLSLADPADLACVRRLAISDALFRVDNREEYQCSNMSANVTVEMLDQIRQRLTGLQELAFVTRGDRPLHSADAVRTAIDALHDQHRDWRVPEWKILALTS